MMTTTPENITHAYLNGEYQPLDAIQISPLDRGFLFADGVYEVIPVYDGKPLGMAPHLERLARSLDAVRIPNPHDQAGWLTILENLIKQSAAPNQTLYLQVTRGASEKRDHAFPADNVKPTVFAMSTIANPKRPTALRAISVADDRWNRCDIKSIGLQANALARQQAIDAGVDDAIFIRNGEAIEGAASNLFVVKNGQLLTQPGSNRLLPGITRRFVIELAENHAVPIQERAISEAELHSADEIWLTSSTREIAPVIELDGQPVGDQTTPVWERMYAWYDALKQAPNVET